MTTYRPADHIIFKASDHIFIFLVSESAIFKIEPKIESIIKLFNKSEKLDKKEVLKKIEVSGVKDYKDITDNLINHRIFIPSAQSPKNISCDSNNIYLKTLVFNLTDACNLSCLYCYHNKAIKNNDMNLGSAKKAVDFLFDNSGLNKEVTIVFFGGEPLIKFDLIKSITQYAAKKGQKLQKKVDFAVTTNGTLLDEEVIEFFYQNRIGVTISIDGPPEIHDRFRRFPDLTPSYSVILPKIKDIIYRFKTKGGKPIAARATVAKDAKHLPKTIEHLLELGFAEAGFGPVTTDNPACQLNNYDMNVLLDKFKELSDKFLEHAKYDRFFGFTNIIDLLVVLHQGEVKNYPCGAGLGLFAVSADENLYLCQRLIGNSLFCMGNLYSGFDTKAIEEFRKKAKLSAKQECRSCEVRYICAGGCYHEALIREKKLTKANLHYCSWIKEWIKYGLKIYGELILKNEGYLDKLSALRGHCPINL